MLKILLLNLSLIGPFIYNNLIFLNTPDKSIEYKIDFNLSKEDIRYVRYYFLKNQYKDFSNLPKNGPRKNVNKFFLILRNQKHKEWITAYLYLLTIVPEQVINEEIGC